MSLEHRGPGRNVLEIQAHLAASFRPSVRVCAHAHMQSLGISEFRYFHLHACGPASVTKALAWMSTRQALPLQ